MSIPPRITAVNRLIENFLLAVPVECF